MSAELLGTLERVVSAAVRVKGTYKKRAGESHRAFGGVNVVMCADFWQLHPVTGTFLASNPLDVPAGCAHRALELFWQDGDDSVRSFWQLTELMRCDDEWYNSFLSQCRVGNLSMEDYSYFHGLPTLTSPCAGKCGCNDDVVDDSVLGPCRQTWKDRFLGGCADMEALQTSPDGECAECRAERAKRHRVLTDGNCQAPELRTNPFSAAPALYTFNVPRYFATNLRAREFAKQKNVQLSWCYARDVPLHPGDRDLPREKLDTKLFSWLRRHDQETGHIPSIYPLAKGMPIRLTDNVDRSRQLYRHRKGVIYGWTMAPGCTPQEIEGEFILDTLPLVIYLHFPEAQWSIGKLPTGVYPLKRRSRTWKVNKHTGIEARRTGFWMLPDFGSTAHMIQGATLEAAFADLQHFSSRASMTAQIAAYVCLSRVKRLLSICVMQPFSTFLFALGNPVGPERLVRKLSGQITADEAIYEWSALDDEAAEAEKMDPMARKHLCACCYLKGKKDYMLDARDFGVKAAADFYEKYVSQGRWTRCLDCAREVGAGPPRPARASEASNGAPDGKGRRTVPPDDSVCKRCVERDDWNHSLTPNSHGCSACKKVFDAGAWSAQIIRHHRHSNRDLVCPGCAERGIAPGKYDEHQCEECLERLGRLAFDKYVLYNAKRQEKSRLVCLNCQTKLRCGKCKTAYELKYWSKSERDHHASSQGTTLVCKACRALGFHPCDLETYTCQTCACSYGARRFQKIQLDNHKNHNRKKLQCMQCVAGAEERVRQLRKQMQKSKRRCKCHCLIHQEKCPLTPVIFGEKRWPGSDGAISADDRKFLDKLNPIPEWWSKAWGQ